MAWTRWFTTGLAVGLTLVALWLRPWAAADRVAVDFVDAIESASLRRPAPSTFRATDLVLAGQAKRAIAATQPSRIAWDQDIPERARLEVSLGLPRTADNAATDGVLFRVGLSHNDQYEEFVTRVVKAADEGDRWIPVVIDLAPYAGRRVSLIFNTAAQTSGDASLAGWGEPRVLVPR